MPKKKFDCRIVFLVLLLTSCGPEKMHVIPSKIEGVTLVWEGSMRDRPELVQIYNETAECLKQNFGYDPKDMPQVILSSTKFDVDTEKDRIGAIVSGIIYLDVGEDFDSRYPVTGFILRIFSHEIVHWITGLSNKDGHNTPPFLMCSQLGQ